jgi:hypothetical protein
MKTKLQDIVPDQGSAIEASAAADELIEFAGVKFNPFLHKSYLTIDTTGEYFKYSLFYKSRDNIVWVRSGDIKKLSFLEKDSKEVIRQGIRSLESHFGIKKPKFIIIISGKNFFIRNVEVPDLKNPELLEAIKWECAKQIPFAIDEAYLKILNTNRERNILKASVAVVLKDDIDRFAFLGNGLTGIVPSPIALFGNISSQKSIGEETLLAIAKTNKEGIINFIRRGKIEFCSCFNLDSPTGIIPEMPGDNEIEKFESNLRNSLDFYYYIYPNQQIGGMIGLGKSADTITSHLSEMTGIEPACYNPYSSFSEKASNLYSELQFAKNDYTLDAGAIFLEKDGFFLPQLVHQLFRQKKYKFYANIMSVLIFIYLAIFLIFFVVEKATKQSKINLLQAQIENIENKAEYQKIYVLTREIENKNTSLNQLEQSPAWAGSLFRVLSHAVTPEIHLTMMEISRLNPETPDIYHIRLEGYYYGDLKSADLTIAAFWERLLHYCGLAGVNFERMGEGYEGNLKRQKFIISATMKNRR